MVGLSVPLLQTPLRFVYLRLRCAAEALRGRGEPTQVNTPASGVQWEKSPVTKTREGRVGARPLLENSTACRKSVPSNNPFVGFFGLIDIAICQVAVLGLVSNSSTESLILAQDERWRRA